MTHSNHLVPSNRNFGLFFATVFFLLSGYAAHLGVDTLLVLALFITSLVFGVIAVIVPRLLMRLNKAWMKLGELMSMVISPLTLGVIFFLVVTPVALVGRFLGRDELRLKKSHVGSYWIDRLPPGPNGDSFNNQF